MQIFPIISHRISATNFFTHNYHIVFVYLFSTPPSHCVNLILFVCNECTSACGPVAQSHFQKSSTFIGVHCFRVYSVQFGIFIWIFPPSFNFRFNRCHSSLSLLIFLDENSYERSARWKMSKRTLNARYVVLLFFHIFLCVSCDVYNIVRYYTVT